MDCISFKIAPNLMFTMRSFFMYLSSTKALINIYRTQNEFISTVVKHAAELSFLSVHLAIIVSIEVKIIGGDTSRQEDLDLEHFANRELFQDIFIRFSF